jgi:hypothetical protein
MSLKDISPQINGGFMKLKLRFIALSLLSFTAAFAAQQNAQSGSDAGSANGSAQSMSTQLDLEYKYSLEGVIRCEHLSPENEQLWRAVASNNVAEMQ